MSVISTPDLSDEAPEVCAIELQFNNYGAIKQFGGQVVTIKCHEEIPW
jgi:regulator of ribonuclease activity A